MLKDYVAIYVPSKEKGGKRISKARREKMIKRIATALCNINGGVTVYPAQGGWIDASNTLVIEEVTVIKSFGGEIGINNNIDTFYQLANNLAFEFNQECVSLEINGAIDFVEPMLIPAIMEN